MKESVVTLFLLFAVTAFCWFLVYSKRSRHKLQKPAFWLYKLNKREHQEMYEAMYFAAVLVLALAFTIFSLFAVIRVILNPF